MDVQAVVSVGGTVFISTGALIGVRVCVLGAMGGRVSVCVSLGMSVGVSACLSLSFLVAIPTVVLVREQMGVSEGVPLGVLGSVSLDGFVGGSEGVLLDTTVCALVGVPDDQLFCIPLNKLLGVMSVGV